MAARRAKTFDVWLYHRLLVIWARNRGRKKPNYARIINSLQVLIDELIDDTLRTEMQEVQ